MQGYMLPIIFNSFSFWYIMWSWLWNLVYINLFLAQDIYVLSENITQLNLLVILLNKNNHRRKYNLLSVFKDLMKIPNFYLVSILRSCDYLNSLRWRKVCVSDYRLVFYCDFKMRKSKLPTTVLGMSPISSIVTSSHLNLNRINCNYFNFYLKNI